MIWTVVVACYHNGPSNFIHIWPQYDNQIQFYRFFTLFSVSDSKLIEGVVLNFFFFKLFQSVYKWKYMLSSCLCFSALWNIYQESMMFYFNASEIARSIQVIFLFVCSLSYIYFRSPLCPTEKWCGLHRFVCHWSQSHWSIFTEPVTS